MNSKTQVGGEGFTEQVSVELDPLGIDSGN